MVVLGLVSTKGSKLESVDSLVRRVEEAKLHCEVDRLVISPQCGFATSVIGNALSEEDQQRKLRRVVEAAGEIW